MTTRIIIQPSVGIQKKFAAKVQSWANEVLEKKGLLAAPAVISINIWRRMDELQSFYQKEKQELGIATGEEMDFLATHEAWRGDPRIHICQEIEALVLLNVEGAETIKNKWQEAYYWLSVTVKEGLVGFAHSTMAHREKSFQKRMEDVTINLISEASL